MIRTICMPTFLSELSEQLHGQHDVEDSLIPYIKRERQIVSAMQNVTSFYEASGEPWRYVQDLPHFQSASRHFVVVARRLPDWSLDRLGRALSAREILGIGCTLRPDQLKLAESLSQALLTTALDDDTCKHASWFYREIGSFGSD